MPADSKNTTPGGRGRDEAAASSDKLNDLWRDPPPRLATVMDTAEERAKLRSDVSKWLDRDGQRNHTYLRSWDPRTMCQLPLLSRFWGCDEAWYRQVLNNNILVMTRMAGRRLSPDELSLFAFYASKGVVAASYDKPLAFGVTAFFLWRGKATCRMPFYQPRFTRFAHPQTASRPFLSGLAWHGTRMGAYGALGYAAYRLLSGPYQEYMTESFSNEGIMLELGLKELAEDMDANILKLARDEEKRRGLDGRFP